MRRTTLVPALLLILVSCGTAGTGDATTTTSSAAGSTTTPEPTYPVTVEADNGAVTIDTQPEAIVSLSATATEMIYALGAGDQVAAVDDQSNYPDEAPTTDLSSYTPNVEAILGYEPDLVIVSFDPGELVVSLDAAEIPVLSLDAALSLDDVYRQIEVLGAATGHTGDAKVLNETIENELNQIVADAPDVPDDTTFYHEVDNTFYTATSTTFIGQIYEMFGLDNIGDAADPDGSSFGFPQLSSEYIASADPDLIFLANALYGESAETVAQRPGWDSLSAVQNGHVVELDSDIVSRWGPRIVEFAQSVSAALEAYMDQG